MQVSKMMKHMQQGMNIFHYVYMQPCSLGSPSFRAIILHMTLVHGNNIIQDPMVKGHITCMQSAGERACRRDLGTRPRYVIHHLVGTWSKHIYTVGAWKMSQHVQHTSKRMHIHVCNARKHTCTCTCLYIIQTYMHTYMYMHMYKHNLYLLCLHMCRSTS